MRSWVEELKKEIKKDVYEKRPTSPIDHCVFEEDSQKPLQSFIEIANGHKDKTTLKQQREEIFLEIAIKEKELLEKYTDIKIKYYDWEAGQHVNPNSIILFTSIIKERIRELDRVILEGMTTKDFQHLYGGIDSTGILSISPNLVSSTFAQDVVTKGVEATTHQFGSEFPGAFIHSIGDFDPQSYSKVDAQAHLAHASANKAAADPHAEDHVFAYQATDYVLPTAEQMTTNMTTVASGDFFGDQMKQMIWPSYGQVSPLTGTDSDGNLSSYSYPWNDHVFPDNAYYEALGYDMNNLTSTQQEKVIRERVSFVGGKYGGVSGTYHDENHFLDITYGTARSIDETSFDIVAGAVYDWDDPVEWPNLQHLDLGPGWGWIYRSQIGNPRYNTTKEHWQYQENQEDFYVNHLEDIIGVTFPAVKEVKYLDGDEIFNSYLQPGGFDSNMEDGDLPGDNNVNYAGARNECSAHKKIIQNAHAGDVITFTYRVASEQWDNTEGYDINGDGDGPYIDVIGEPNELYVVAGKRIMKVWSLYKELPDAETTDTYGFVLRNTESAIDSGTFSYTIQQEDINSTTGALDFVTAYHADDLYFNRVSITNFAISAGEEVQKQIAKKNAGSTGETTAAYDLGYSVYKSVQTKPKGKKKKDDEEEEEGNVTSTTTGGVVDAETDAEVQTDTDAQTDTDVDMDTSTEPEVKQEVKQFENVPDNEDQEEQIIDDLEQQEQEEDEQIEQEKETDEIESEKEKFLDELQGDEETTEDEKNIFSDIFDKVIDYAAEITGHRTSKEVLKLYNAYLKGADYVQGDINSDGEVDLFGGFSNTSDYNPYASFKDQAYLRSALNDPEFERIHAKAMNTNNEKSKHLYLHALGDKVEAKIQDYILGDKGLRNSLFQGVKLDRNAFLQSNGKYISFTKDYKFRPGGSVAEAEKSWVGKLLSGFGFKLDTLGSGNLIDKIGGLLAGKLLDGADQYGDLYNAPVMPMRFDLHYRGGGNVSRIPYRSNGWSSNVNDINPEAIRGGYVNRGSWWEEDPELGAMQEISPSRYSQNYTPELIGPDHKLNPRTGEWELPRDEQGNWTSGSFGDDGDDFWWLDPNFKDLSGYGKEKEKEKQPTDNFYDDLTATDAATLVAFQRKKKRGQGGRKLGDTTKRGGEVNELVNYAQWIIESSKKKNNLTHYEKKLERKKINKIEKEKRRKEIALERQKIKDRSKWSQQTEPNPNALYPGQPSPNGFPDNPPPKLGFNGYHPEFGKKSDRYRKLDPVSAVVMNRVKTDDPETNKQVAAAAAKSPKQKKTFDQFNKYLKR